MINCLHIFSPILSFGINVTSQVCIVHYIPGFSLLRSVLFGFIIGICNLSFIEFFYVAQTPLPLTQLIPFICVNILTYTALGYGYFHFVNMGETARRIRILRELYDSEKGLSIEELLKCYNAKDIIEQRINRLIGNGQIIYRGGKYYIGNPIMLLIAKVIVAMKLIVLGKKSEFEGKV